MDSGYDSLNDEYLKRRRSTVQNRELCAYCKCDISHLMDWDCIKYGPELCSAKCVEKYKEKAGTE